MTYDELNTKVSFALYLQADGETTREGFSAMHKTHDQKLLNFVRRSPIEKAGGNAAKWAGNVRLVLTPIGSDGLEGEPIDLSTCEIEGFGTAKDFHRTTLQRESLYIRLP